LLSMVKPLIEKQNTVLRESVSAEISRSLVSAFSARILCITGVPQTPVIFITL
jgi:hypothetical protein